MRVTSLNAKSQNNLTTERILKKNAENEKKRAYIQRIIEIEHGTLTPLVFGTNCFMGKECQIFHKKLALKLSAKWKKKYSEMINDIRTQESFSLIKFSLLVLERIKDWILNYCLNRFFG